MDNLLPVPTKHTQKFDLASVLAKVITREFYEPPAVNDELRQLDELRSFLVDPEPSLHRISELKEYYMQLSALRAKLPPDSAEFSWWPLFATDNSQPVKIKSLLWDQCNTLFQIAALYSQLATQQSRYSGEGLKRASVYFQYAAGCFKHIDDVLTPELHVVPADLSSDSLSALAYLSLASAQEIVWLKAVTDNLKDTVVAKLAMQVAQLYGNTLAFESKCSIYPSSWLDFCRVKQAHFSGAAYYRMATHASNQEHYGDAIAYLQKAAAASQKGAGLYTGKVQEDLDNLRKVVAEDLRKSTRENDLIYLQPVPDTVKEPSLVSLVKPLIESELSRPVDALEGRALFSKLVPIHIVELAASFKERLLTYIDLNFDKPITSMNEQIDKFVSDLHLDTQLDSVLKPQQIPNSIIQYAHSIQDMGGMARLDSLYGDLGAGRLQSRSELDESWTLLKDAADRDDSLRSIYGERRWTLRHVSDETGDIQEQLGSFEDYLNASESGDVTIQEKVSQLREYVHVFDSEESLELFVPKADVLQLNPQMKSQIIALKEQVTELQQLQTDRATFLQKVHAKYQSVNLLQQVLDTYRQLAKSSGKLLDETEYEHIFEADQSQFQDEIPYVPRTKNDQDTRTALIKKDMVSFMGAKRQLKMSQEREQALDVLSQTYRGYCEVLGNIKQGLEFYKNLLDNIRHTQSELSEYLDQRSQATVALQYRLDEADRL